MVNPVGLWADDICGVGVLLLQLVLPSERSRCHESTSFDSADAKRDGIHRNVQGLSGVGR